MAQVKIYLGQVETTRRIKKLVLTGEEAWEISNNTILASPFTGIISGYYQSFCDRYVFKDTYNGVYRNDGTFAISSSRVLIHDSNYSTVDDFKSYLAAQYRNGTPVTIWYVLAESETAVVNEPLMKIGGYADTVSMAQAGVTIPTISGANVLDMTSTVKPSEVYIKGKGIKPIA